MGRTIKNQGISKNKKIRMERKKPLPIALMKGAKKNDESKRNGVDGRGISENYFLTETI
jgi:hypothetical protein